ncbi:MAG: hypothetical protein DWQ06_14615 [Calditrichaeota bacterium]|nr:MAG: hypothetical protein DWQ06_14615 [Calditrichota bacterium]
MQKILLILLLGIFIGCSEDEENDFQAPSNLTVTQITPSEVQITWEDNTDDEQSFVLERSPNGVSFELLESLLPNTTSYIDTGLVSGNVYGYRVSAFKIKTDLATSETVLFRTLVAPTNLSASSISNSSLKLNWSDNSDSELKFVIERSNDNDNFSRIDSVDADISEFIDVNLDSTQSYFYRVIAHTTNNSAMTNTIEVSYLGNTFFKKVTSEFNDISALTVSPDNSKVIFLEEDNSINALDVNIELMDLWSVSNSSDLWRLSFFPDGSCFTSFSDYFEEENVRVWSAETGNLIWKPSHSPLKGIRSYKISSNGKKLITGGVDGVLKVWDSKSGNFLWSGVQNEQFEASIYRVAITQDNTIVTSFDEGGNLKAWDLLDGNLIWNKSSIHAIILDINKYICFYDANRHFGVLDVNSGNELWFNSVNTLEKTYKVLLNTSRLITLGKFLKVWDLETGSLIWQGENGESPNIYPNILVNSSETKIFSTIDDIINVWDAANGNKLWSYQFSKGNSGWNGVLSNDESKLLLSGWDGGNIVLLNTVSGELIWEGKHGDDVSNVVILEGGNSFLSVGNKNELALWEYGSGWSVVE